MMMIVIWGSKAKTKVLGRGQFYCPQCRTLRPYEHQQLSKYFTLYFIPLFETEKLGEYVQCQGCRTPYKPEVLELSKQSRVAEFLSTVSLQLEGGLAVQVILNALVESGLSKQEAGLVVFSASKGKLARCNDCQLLYARSLAYCSNCGKKLVPFEDQTR